MNKSPIAAFLLSFIPGVGHAYLGRPIRAILYGGAFFGPIAMLLLLAMAGGYIEDGFIFFFLFVAGIAALINMIDMIVGLINGKALSPYPSHRHPNHQHAGQPDPSFVPIGLEHQREKSRTILFSFVPGLGHMNLGLMQRGVTFLISFIGWFAIIVFLSMIVHRGELLVFLLALPVIWVYSMFDAISQLHAKQRGELLVDRAIFEDMESYMSSGRKSKVLAIALSIFPGAGHLYLGLQKRGLQLMGGFLLTVYIMDNLRLSLFFFLLPLFWCFAFFDALQQTSRYERQTLTDEPVLTQLVPYQRWFGLGLLGFGAYYLLDRVAVEVTSHFSNQLYSQYMQIKYMIPTAVVAFVMIIVGLRLAFGSKAPIHSSKGKPPERPPTLLAKREEESH
ncbi:hypothetical protein BK133_18265 [Paenibacillus sp. FSL H8-0548]|uniref:hypothetical protein n=1 Tax=Paenibacillus sp. FSL H8-0548 TaxID=1920422 RepID=UPI00096E45BB|nr:hypothetical protein [Paenibacillus sp. FSL H8-0548]OMF29085.1 hypothetical protein BK133_18265 [Paenibacillus sp. FSL H8-0548]